MKITKLLRDWYAQFAVFSLKAYTKTPTPDPVITVYIGNGCDFATPSEFNNWLAKQDVKNKRIQYRYVG